jgi:hypothetical protein
MSGGHFDYDQHRITHIADSIEREIERSGKEIDPEERDNYWSDQTHHHEYSNRVLEEFKKGIEFLRKAQIYAHRIDYLLSGDDGEDSFVRRLNEDLKKLEQNENN